MKQVQNECKDLILLTKRHWIQVKLESIRFL